MSDLGLLVRDELCALVPEPQRPPDWPDVLARAEPPLRRRTLVLALAAALIVLGTAAGVTAALGGFDVWLSGEPGTPAPATEQQRFEVANARSLDAFPKDTKLRELIRTDIGGKRYVLYGFRSGTSLCVRLKAVSLGHSIEASCASASALMHSPAPILVIDADDGFEDRHAHPSAEVSFGIAADGVSRVEIHAVDGTHRAAVDGNAYLWVENEPNTGNRIWSITAVSTGGSRTTIPVSASGFGLATTGAPLRQARGPDHVQARIPHPTVGWFVRREPRGVALNRVKHPPGFRDRGFARLVKPDPNSNIVVGIAGRWCILEFGNGSGESCTDGRGFWARGPLNAMVSGGPGEFAAVTGAAADGIDRVVVFLADGQRQRAAMRDNLFATLVAWDEFPIRIVAYDGRGRVVGIETFAGLARGAAPAAAGRRLRRVVRTTGPHGVVAVGRVGPSVRGVTCWRVDFTTGQSPGACVISGPWVWVDLVQPAGRDLFVIGHARRPIARVQLEFTNGDKISTRPIAGLYVFAIPRAHLDPQRQLAYAVGYTSTGHRVQRQGVVFRAP